MTAISATLSGAASTSSAPSASAQAPQRTTSPPSPERVWPSALPSNVSAPEVSMVEASDFTGVTFTPELWIQRRHWAIEVLRAEGVRSVLDLGCGPGSLLQTLLVPPSTVTERPIADPTTGECPEGRELFISRLTGVDQNASVMPTAMQTVETPASTPRWEPLQAEVWLGDIQRFNGRLEGHEAIVALELVEHLEPHILSRFGVVTLGTYRPKLMLVSTPNFDFNAKFPDHDALCDNCDKRGFADPTGRTDRVFRHSDHKCEMTAAEFESWATGAAHDWGYSVEISGVGTSNKPSYYKAKDGQPPRPVYASQTAVFRLETGIALRSPRSVRTVELPFMRGSSEAVHPHRLAAKKVHPATAVRAPGAPLPPAAVAAAIADVYASISVPTISLAELWGHEGVAAACGGSQRHLVASLGGWGDVPPLHDASTAFSVARTGTGLVVTRR